MAEEEEAASPEAVEEVVVEVSLETVVVQGKGSTADFQLNTSPNLLSP